MTESLFPFSGDLIAVTIALPTSAGNGARLTTLIAQGAILTPAADLPSRLTSLSSVADGIAPVGSSPQSRALAQLATQVLIENHAANFQTDYAPAMPGLVVRATGTPYASPQSMKAAQRVYARSAAAGFSATAICHLAGTPMNAGT